MLYFLFNVKVFGEFHILWKTPKYFINSTGIYLKKTLCINFPHRYFRRTNLQKKNQCCKQTFRFITIICYLIKEWRCCVVRTQVFIGLYSFLCTHICMYEVSLSFHKCGLDEKTLWVAIHVQAFIWNQLCSCVY